MSPSGPTVSPDSLSFNAANEFNNTPEGDLGGAMVDEERKQEFLARIKSEGRSSPTGKHWADFHAVLTQHQRVSESGRPLAPLILAASGASDSDKHQRLSDQLDWAIVNDCFEAAIDFLENLDDDNWNNSMPDNWNAENYP